MLATAAPRTREEGEKIEIKVERERRNLVDLIVSVCVFVMVREPVDVVLRNGGRYLLYASHSQTKAKHLVKP